MTGTRNPLTFPALANSSHTANDQDVKLNDDPIDRYLLELVQTINQLSRESIWAVTNVLLAAWQRGSQILILGNGGSAATASHMANDLNKLTIVPGKQRFKTIALTDNVPLMTAWGNDSSYADIFSEQMLNFLHPADVVISISASGNSPNVLKAVQVAREHGAITVGFTGHLGGKLREMVDYCVMIPSDHIGQQEDGHMILDHVIANTLRKLIEGMP